MENIVSNVIVRDEPALEVDVVLCRKGNSCLTTRRWVVEETPVTLYFNGEQMITLMCAGRYLDELAVGFFIGEGWIKEREKLVGVKVARDHGIVDVNYAGSGTSRNKFWLKRAITSGCGKGSVFCEVLDDLLAHPISSEITISVNQVWHLMNVLNHYSIAYKRTHGVHNCVIATPEEVIHYRYDIGRHNALDMLIGRAFLDSINLSDKLFVTTGRLTSEIIIKAAQVGIPLLASRHAATKLAVDLAQTLNITLIGYIRGGQLTIYTGKDRVRFS